MNKVDLIGRITAKPELRYNANNTVITKINIAVNREYKNKNGEYEALFKAFNLDLWEEYCEEVTKKGKAGYVRITLPKKGENND